MTGSRTNGHIAMGMSPALGDVSPPAQGRASLSGVMVQDANVVTDDCFTLRHLLGGVDLLSLSALRCT